MRVKEILGEANPTDIVATAEIGDPRLNPPEHVVNVANIAITNPTFTTSPEVATFVIRWLTQQATLQGQAAEVVARLEQVAPLPTPEELINGNPDWPTWMGQWWASVLRFPWAGQLGEAIVAAWEWLDGKP